MNDRSPTTRPTQLADKTPSRAPSPTPATSKSKKKIDFSPAVSLQVANNQPVQPTEEPPKSEERVGKVRKVERSPDRSNKKQALEQKIEAEISEGREQHEQNQRNAISMKHLSGKRSIKEGHSNLESLHKEFGSEKVNFDVSDISPKKIATESKKTRIVEPSQKSRTEIKMTSGDTDDQRKPSLRSHAKKAEQDKQEKKEEQREDREEPLLTEELDEPNKENKKPSNSSTSKKRSRPTSEIKEREIKGSVSKSPLRQKSPVPERGQAKKSTIQKERGTTKPQQKSILKKPSKSAVKEHGVKASTVASKPNGTTGSKKVKLHNPAK